jgi:hypothetical protein
MTENRTVAQLLSDYASILDALRDREIVRSANNPLSDYAELLFCNAYGWKREGNSASGHDAIDTSGVRYQIKARRITPHNRSRQLSAIRNLDKRPSTFSPGFLLTRNLKSFGQHSSRLPSLTKTQIMSPIQTAGSFF